MLVRGRCRGTCAIGAHDNLQMDIRMTDNVTPFTGITSLPIDPQRVLQAALDAGLKEVVICGFDANGDDYFASSEADAGAVNWVLDRAKWNLMQQVDALIEG